MLRRFSINFAIFSMALDAAWVVFALWLSTELRPALNAFVFIRSVSEGLTLPEELYVIFPLAWVAIFSAFSVYDSRKLLRMVDEFAILTLASVVASISLAGILYLSYREVSRALFLVFVFFAYCFFFGWRLISRLIFRLRKDWPDAPKRILIVGSGPLGGRVKEQIDVAGIANMRCVGFVDDENVLPEDKKKALLGGIKDIRAIISDMEITDVVIALPHSIFQRMSDVVSVISDMPVKVWVALGFFDLALYKTDIEDFAGIPMLDLRAPALSDYQRFIKRGFDLIAASAFLLIALPLMGLAAVAIWLDDGLPVVFRQARAGENGRLFNMVKFRTMVKNAEQLRSLIERADENGNIIHKTKDDPRVTRVGRFLRRTSLDELPQLFNVLAGEMSLVGPRPELPYLVENYQPWQRKRFAVPPGITGWWQVIGRSDRAMHLHTEDDLYYVQNYSIWLDLQIILRTVWTVLLGRGAY